MKKTKKHTISVRKNKGQKKNFIKVLLSMVAVVIVFTIVNRTAKAKFWNNISTSEISLNKEEYSLEVEYALEEYNQINDNIKELTQNATELSDEEVDFFTSYNTYIENYFVDVYGISVQNKIDTIEVKKLDIFSATEDESFTLNGVYDSDVNTIYISADLCECLDWYVGSVYVHETIHGLGFDATEDDEMMYLYEGITEYLTSEIFSYNNLEYLNMTMYIENTQIAKQIILADNAIIEMILQDEEFSLERQIDENTSGYAEQLENMLFLKIFASYTQKDITLRAQYIASKYCSEVNCKNARNIVESNAIVKCFELKCMLKGWR